MDRYIGQIFDVLRSSGLLDTTLIFIVGDHGEAFGEHGYVGHQIFCYEEELRIPFLVFAGNHFRPRRIRQPANLVDVVPTVLDIWGFDMPASIQGHSLLPALKGHEKQANVFYFESFYPLDSMGCAPVKGLIRRPFKYIDLPRAELYDLKKDPLEKDNQLQSNPELATRLNRELGDFITTHLRENAASLRTLSSEERDRLSSLGYIAANRLSIPDKELPDPKDKIAAFVEYTLAKTLDDEAKPEDAARHYATAIALNPRFGMAYAKLGDLYVGMGKNEEALKTYERGFRESPHETFLRTQYAALLLKLDKTDQASKVVEDLEKEAPRDSIVEIFLLAADIKVRQNQPDQALAYYRQAQAVEPENSELVKKMILLLNAQERWEDSLPLYKVLEKKNPEDAAVVSDMALLFAKMGNYDTAEVYFQKALTLSQDENLYFNYALLLDRKDNVREAVNQMKKFLSLINTKHPKYELALKALKDFESRL